MIKNAEVSGKSECLQYHTLTEIEVRFDLCYSTNQLGFTSTFNDLYRVVLVKSKKAVVELDFNTLNVEGPFLLCLSPGQHLSINPSQHLDIYEIGFDREFYCVETQGKKIACNGVLFNNMHKAAVIPLSTVDYKMLEEYFTQIKLELTLSQLSTREMLDAYLKIILVETLRRQQVLPSEGPNASDPTVASFIVAIENNYTKLHSVQEYADLLFLQPKSLSKKLKALGYPTPLQMIQNRIILAAKRKLKFSADQVKSIAYELGFDDPAYFNRLFLKLEGMSPLTYRNEST